MPRGTIGRSRRARAPPHDPTRDEADPPVLPHRTPWPSRLPPPTQPGAAVRCTRHVRLRRAGGRGCRWCGQGRRTMAEEPRTWWSDGSHVRSGKKRSETHVPWE
eukprot:scaffold1454_cov342-Pavlova_lutheri.AAC.11